MDRPDQDPRSAPLLDSKAYYSNDTTPVARVLARLPDARPCGSGYEARCPGHEDRDPSLSITEGEGGKVLLHDHAGCPVERIVAALGLTLADLFQSERPPRKTAAAPRRIVATYAYRDEDGALLYEVVRYQPKEFRQRRPDGQGGWQWSLQGVRRVLYHLPALQAADPAAPVFKCEGEKDTDNVRALGLVATTNAGGAAKWRADYSDALRDRCVVLLPHNDAAGEQDTDQVAGDLHRVARWVKVVKLPGLAQGGDVSDWLAAGGTRAQLLELVAATPVWEPPAVARLKAERDEARATLSAVMGVLHRGDLSPTERVIGAVTVCEQLQYQRTAPLAPDDPACSHEARAVLAQGYQLAPPQERIAEAAQVSRGTVARVWKGLGELGLLDRQEASVRRHAVDRETGEVQEGWTKRTFFRLAGDGATHEALSPLATAPLAPDHRKHGGPRPKPVCPACGSDAHVRWQQVPVCDRHGLQLAGAGAQGQDLPRMYQDGTFGEAPSAPSPPDPAPTYPEELRCAKLIRSEPAADEPNPALDRAPSTKLQDDTFGSAAADPSPRPPAFAADVGYCAVHRRPLLMYSEQRHHAVTGEWQCETCAAAQAGGLPMGEAL
jgi:ribosomal protein L37AE/L43A